MPDYIRHIRPGDKISAREWNKLARMSNQDVRMAEGEISSNSVGSTVQNPTQRQVVEMKATEDIPSGGIFTYDGINGVDPATIKERVPPVMTQENDRKGSTLYYNRCSFRKDTFNFYAEEMRSGGAYVLNLDVSSGVPIIGDTVQWKRKTTNVTDDSGDSDADKNHKFDVVSVDSTQRKVWGVYQGNSAGGTATLVGKLTSATSGGDVIDGDTVEVQLVDDALADISSSTQENVINNTGLTLLEDTIVYLFEIDNWPIAGTATHSMYPAQLASCPLVDPQAQITA